MRPIVYATGGDPPTDFRPFDACPIQLGIIFVHEDRKNPPLAEINRLIRRMDNEKVQGIIILTSDMWGGQELFDRVIGSFSRSSLRFYNQTQPDILVDQTWRVLSKSGTDKASLLDSWNQTWNSNSWIWSPNDDDVPVEARVAEITRQDDRSSRLMEYIRAYLNGQNPDISDAWPEGRAGFEKLSIVWEKIRTETKEQKVSVQEWFNTQLLLEEQMAFDSVIAYCFFEHNIILKPAWGDLDYLFLNPNTRTVSLNRTGQD